MKPNTLVVSEVFYSIQGEGTTTGVPSVFLRLAGCNLLCDHKWRCDTIEVWQKGKAIDFEDILSTDQKIALIHDAHLVITGGEPLLQQAAIVQFLSWLRKSAGLAPCVEIETNGTINPLPSLLSEIHFWNVSPKLSNSGMCIERRVNENALRAINTGARNAMFKFVITSSTDWNEIQQDYGFLPKRSMVLMPGADNAELLDVFRPSVMDICKINFVRYSDRLHIAAWNKKTGV